MTVSIDHSQVVTPVYHVGHEALAISEVIRDEVKLQADLDILVLVSSASDSASLNL